MQNAALVLAAISGGIIRMAVKPESDGLLKEVAYIAFAALPVGYYTGTIVINSGYVIAAYPAAYLSGVKSVQIIKAALDYDIQKIISYILRR